MEQATALKLVSTALKLDSGHNEKVVKFYNYFSFLIRI